MDEAAHSWPAPAKLNLFLHIVGRRGDGYHELQSCMQFVDWCDELTFSIEADGALRCAGLENIAERDNLVLRAARLLKSRSGTASGALISVKKQIPVGAGLGGGSSDAATTLRALNRLWGLELGLDELAGLGLELGADVPFFVRGRSAIAQGVGERLTPVEPPCPWYLILETGVSVSTREVFKHPALTRNSPKATISGFALSPGRNDCQPVTCRLEPEISRALDWLSSRASAHMSGTGSALFAAFESAADARTVAAQVPKPWRAKVARGLNRSPLVDIAMRRHMRVPGKIDDFGFDGA